MASITKNKNVKHIKKVAHEMKNDVKHDMNKAARQAGISARKLLDFANDEFEYVTDVVKTEIRANPIKSGAIALGVGFVLGLILRR